MKQQYPKDFDKARPDYPRGEKLDVEQKAILDRLRVSREARDERWTPHAKEVLEGLEKLEALEKKKIPFSREIEYEPKK